MEHVDFVRAIAEGLRRMPEWVRNDLASKDGATRVRAEETLAAIIAAVLADQASGGKTDSLG